MYSPKSRTRVSVAAMSIAAIALLSTACVHPPTSRTGAIHDVRVVEGPEPADLIVNPGDEVRWVNARNLPIRVDLVGVKPEDFACERGFSNIFGVTGESATAKPNESASACFKKIGRRELQPPDGIASTRRRGNRLGCRQDRNQVVTVPVDARRAMRSSPPGKNAGAHLKICGSAHAPSG